LDSLLAQTFKNFEVILVDDCSIDNSVEIIESYVPKFDGRLKLAKMEKNSGSGSLPRNKGLRLSRGEFVFNMDNDDALTETALEEMYTLAKGYDADVVYCERYYTADDRLENRSVTSFHARETLVDKPTVESPLLPERLNRISRFWVTPWTKLIKRKLLIEHQIIFPNIIRDDTIWTWCLVFYAKKFLRVPNAVYIWRETPTSITRCDKKPEQVINFWLNPVILGVKILNERLQKIDFFQKNPQRHYALLEDFIQGSFNSLVVIKYRQQINSSDIFKAIKEEFAENLGEYDVLIPALCSILINEENSHHKVAQELRKFKTAYIELQSLSTARIDIEFLSENTTDFQILSVSDNKAVIRKAGWLKDSTGYFVHSYAKELNFVVKAISDGHFDLTLRGKDIRDPEDNSKRIPHWIDYTKLVVNGEIIFDTLTPAWHNKPYIYKMDVKADEEISIRVEWLPHNDKKSNVQDVQISKKLSEQDALISELHNALAAEKKIHSNDVELISKFKDYFTARVDVELESTEQGELKIISVSDEKASISRAKWLTGNSIGYFVQSYTGKLELVAKAISGGRFKLVLRGKDVRNHESKRIPYWVDYTKLIVNGEVLFDELKPVWHNKPFRYGLDVKADEEVSISVEWLPHRSNT
jgi:glycosyltransferase involved in cell wall biosynthesis/stress response protein YsnF